MTLFLLTWFLYSVAEGYEQARYPFVDHKRSVVRRMFTGFACLTAYYHTEIFISFQWAYISFGLLLASSFWVLFELSYNAAKQQSLIYIGETADTDIFFKEKLGEWKTFFLRVATLILSIVLQIIFSNV